MAERFRRLSLRPGRAWLLLSAAAALGAVVLSTQASTDFDWQPGFVLTQPWRSISAAWVHLSAGHLAANLAGAALVAAFGWVGRVPTAMALAWLAAWPLTHWALLLRPQLLHYAGLSGVLHAGVAAAAVGITCQGTHRQRLVALLVLAGLGAKVASEQPWGPLLRQAPGWDIAIAPLAHATGSVAGLLCAGLVLVLSRGRQHLTQAATRLTAHQPETHP